MAEYTFTIEVTPSTATVSVTVHETEGGQIIEALSGTGKLSVTAGAGSYIEWSASADGFNLQSGSLTLEEDVSLRIVLSSFIVSVGSVTLDPSELTYGADATDGAVVGAVSVKSFRRNSASPLISDYVEAYIDGDTVPDWLSLSLGYADELSTYQTLTVRAMERNADAAARTASIRIYNDYNGEAQLAVTQTGAYITVEQSSLAFTDAGGAQEVVVSSSDGTRHVDQSTVPDWIEVSYAVGSLSVIFTVSENGSGLARNASVRIYNDSGAETYISVTQRDIPTYVTVEPSSLTFTDAGGAQEVVVSSSDGTRHVDQSTVPDWIEVSYAVGSLSVIFTVSENGSGLARNASVRIYNDSGAQTYISVTQDGHDEWKVTHFGEFPDIRGAVWRVEISRRDVYGDVDVGELTFPADRPLVIEWPSINFEDVVWGSSATLRVVSPGDRTYIDLYTIEPGSIRLDVYRGGELYWSGMLDPEFYEEPYERFRGYEVELTFTDFGILDRLKYDLEGVRPLRDIIDYAVVSAAFNHKMIDMMAGAESHFAVQMALAYDGYREDSSSIFGPSPLCVRSDNFTDEEGEVSTIYEVLEGVLQPLGLRIVQRGGTVTVFDTAGVDTGAVIPQVVWTGDSQTLGVDRVYNGVKVTFSPYAPDQPMGAVTFNDPYDSETTDTSANADDQRCWTFFPDYGGDKTSSDYDFTIFLGAGSGASIYTGSFFHIEPVYGNAEACDGFCFGIRTGHHALSSDSPVICNYPGNARDLTSTDITFPRVLLSGVEGGYNSTYIRIVAELLADCRYNPFSGADSYNDNSNQSALEDNSAFVFARARVTLYDSEKGGNALCHYETFAGILETGARGILRNGSWVEGEDPDASCWLEFYNPDDLKDNSGGVGGWKANRQCIGKPDGKNGSWEYTECNAQFRSAPDGEFIPYPSIGGWLQVELTSYLHGHRYGSSDVLTDGGDSWGKVAGNLRWRLWRNVGVSLVKSSLLLGDMDDDDIEYGGTLNVSAQDELSIDTICGTGDDAAPTARGLYLKSDAGQVTRLYRDGVTDRVEKLLIGSLYSQYAGRKTVLTGEAEIPDSLVLTEANQGDKVFILTADSEDIRMAVSDIEMREIGFDRYIADE